MRILNHMAEKHRISISENVAEKLLPILSAASMEPDFGNGRYVRNLFERARMRQASRLLKMNFDNVKKKDLLLLTADDFEAPPAKRAEIRRIGFSHG
jgi:hypothetical protein